MSCELTQGYAPDCADGISGIKEIRVIEWGYLDTAAGATITATSGIISTLTPASSRKFYLFKLPNKNKDYARQTRKKSDESGMLWYEQEVLLTLRKMQTMLRNELYLHSQATLAMIITDRNGKYWLAGEKNGLELNAGDETTGAGRDDANRYLRWYTGEEEQPWREVSSGIIAGLTY
jgi:hypothetical protein